MIERVPLEEVVDALFEDEGADVALLVDTWQTFARPKQIRPRDAKATTYYRCGRGWGKSYVLSNNGLDECEDFPHKGLIASRTQDEVLGTMIRDQSGLRACARRRGYELEFVASMGSAGTVIHPSGAELRVGSGDVIDGVRGPNLSLVLADELMSWKHGPECLANIEFALRAPCPDGPIMIIAGTPSTSSRVKIDAEDTTVITGTMDENEDNLAPGVVAARRRKYGGSKLGRQELEGAEVNVSGAVVDLDTIHAARVRFPPEEFARVAIGLDPATSGRVDRDAIGILVVGLDHEGHLYVLDDVSPPGCMPEVWGPIAVAAYDRWAAGTIVYERNQGGEENAFVLRTSAGRHRAINIEGVWSKGSKRDRLDRVLAPLYRQGRIHHVGVWAALETELTEWTGGGKSPDHCDALCFAVAHLVGEDEDEDRVGPLISPEDRPPTAPLYLLDDTIERPHVAAGRVVMCTDRVWAESFGKV